MEAITIVIAGIFTSGMVDGLMWIAPFGQAMVDVVLIGEHGGAGLYGGGDHGFDGHLLNVGQHADEDFAATLDEAQYGRLLASQGAPPARAFQSSAPPAASESAHDFRVSLVARHDVDLVGFDLFTQDDGLFFASTPSRNAVVIAWASSLFKSSSAAICWFDRFKPIMYEHTSQTRNG